MMHIIPINDLQEHEEATTCSCLPKVIEANCVMIVIHDAFDGRVGVEVVNEILERTD